MNARDKMASLPTREWRLLYHARFFGSSVADAKDCLSRAREAKRPAVKRIWLNGARQNGQEARVHYEALLRWLNIPEAA